MTNEQTPQPLIDEHRIDEITAIGLIDGGEWTDVLGVSYNDHETTIRIRFEQSGRRITMPLDHGMSLEKALEGIAQSLQIMYPYKSELKTTVLRGRQARKWFKRLLAAAKAVADEGPSESETTNLGQNKTNVTRNHSAK